MVIIILFIYIYTYTCPPYGSLSVLFFISLDQNRIISIHLHPVGISAPVFLISRNVSKTGKQMDFFNFD